MTQPWQLQEGPCQAEEAPPPVAAFLLALLPEYPRCKACGFTNWSRSDDGICSACFTYPKEVP